MLNAIRRATRWIFVSAPGVGVLVISIGLGVGYAATNGGSSQSSTQAPGQSAGPRDGPGFLVAPGQQLSTSDRQALEKFRSCMSSVVKPPSGSSTPPRGTITSPRPSTCCGIFHCSEPWRTGCRPTGRYTRRHRAALTAAPRGSLPFPYLTRAAARNRGRR